MQDLFFAEISGGSRADAGQGVGVFRAICHTDGTET